MEVGRTLAERYEILRPLAEGAMSTVWVARDRTSGDEVAIKTISLDAAGWRAEVRDRFMKEARLLARGKHEYLVGVRDVGETEDGFLYLVLDLLEGETLAQCLARETKLEWSVAVKLALGIARGVAALHRAGIVHRDLKPANIVLHRTDSGVIPTIIDLGIGKASAIVGDPALCATLTATGQVLGTPQYMSYEQALGQTDIDARSDVWALGVILYEMLTGRRPFEAPNTNAVLAAIRRHAVQPIRDVAPDVPVAISRVIERCLRTNRSERFDNAQVLVEQLEAALEAPSEFPDALAPSESPAPPAKRPDEPRRSPVAPRRRGFVMAATAVVVSLPIVVFALGRSMNATPPTTPEIVADVKASPTVSASVINVAATVSSGTTEVPISPAPTTRKTSSSARNRPPVSRVDEAGF